MNSKQAKKVRDKLLEADPEHYKNIRKKRKNYTTGGFNNKELASAAAKAKWKNAKNKKTINSES